MFRSEMTFRRRLVAGALGYNFDAVCDKGVTRACQSRETGSPCVRVPHRISLSLVQSVSEAPHCLDLLRCRPELLPESPQMGIHRPRLHFRVVAPDDLQNLSAA